MSHPSIQYERGHKFGDCTYIEDIFPTYSSNGKWKIRKCKFKCVCGNEFIGRLVEIKSGRHLGCGCRAKTHGLAGADAKGHRTKEYNTWLNIKKRCYNKNNPKYADYGGRGIRVCDRWLNNYPNFLSDIGDAPSNLHSIDRIDNGKDYNPINCRWATPKEQARNRRKNLLLSYNGETLCLSEWAERIKIDQKVLRKRIVVNKLSIKDALEMPKTGVSKSHGDNFISHSFGHIR